MPFVLEGTQLPQKLMTQNLILEYTGALFAVIGPFTVFTHTGSFGNILLETILCVVMGLAAVLMVVALLKIRSCFVDRGLGAQVSPLRMVVHALSFLLYILEYSVFKLVSLLSKQINADYVGWAVDTFFAFFSYICLFFVIWHLGSKTK